MKKHICLMLLLCSMMLTANAQSPSEKQVAIAVENFRKGIMTADRALLESVAADDLVYGHSSGKVQDKQEFIEEIAGKKPIIYMTVELSEQTIKISGNTAVVRHIFSSKIENNGTAGNLKIGNMLIWQKQNGKWKLLARQAYKV